MAQQNSSTPGVDPALEKVDNVSVPLHGYGKVQGTRGGPGVAGVEGGPRPGNRTPVIARTSVDSDPAGAALRIQTVAAGDRARTIRSYLENTPPAYNPLDESQGGRTMTVAENRTGLGQSPLWRRRQQDAR
jgi:hypothetical protein